MYKIIYLPTADVVAISSGFGVNLKVCPKSWFESLITYYDCFYTPGLMKVPWFPGLMKVPWFPGTNEHVSGDLYLKVPSYLLDIVEFPDV